MSNADLRDVDIVSLDQGGDTPTLTELTESERAKVVSFLKRRRQYLSEVPQRGTIAWRVSLEENTPVEVRGHGIIPTQTTASLHYWPGQQPGNVRGELVRREFPLNTPKKASNTVETMLAAPSKLLVLRVQMACN